MMSVKRVLITGANGFIGSELIKELKKSELEVVPLGGTTSCIYKYYGDITNKETFKKLPSCDTIIHLAAMTDYDSIVNNKEECRCNYLLGLENVLEYAIYSNAKNIVFLSSIKVYGNSSKKFTEEDIPAPCVYMGKLKFESENLLREYQQKTNTTVTVLRVSNVYGKNQSKRFFVPKLVDCAINDKVIDVSNLDTERNYIYISDLIEAIKLFLAPKSPSFNLFNVGYIETISLRKIIELVENRLDKKISYNLKINYRSDESLFEDLDITKIKKIGWSPFVNFEQGLNILLDIGKE